MPKIRALYRHELGSRFSPSREYMVGKEGVEYLNHYLVLRNQKHGRDRFFCGHCGEFSDAVYVVADAQEEEVTKATAHEDNHLITVTNVEDRKAVLAFHCSLCNQYIAAPVVQPINEREKVENHSLAWAEHYEEANDIVRLKWMSRKVSAWNSKLQITYTKYMVMMNTRTGQTYVFEPWTNGKRSKGYGGPKLANITYDSYLPAMSYYNEIPKEIMKSFYETVYEKIAERLGYRPKGLEQYHEEHNAQKEERKSNVQRRRGNRVQIPRIDMTSGRAKNLYSLEQIALFNRFPNMNPIHMQELVRLHRRQQTYVVLDDGKTMLHSKYEKLKEKKKKSTRRPKNVDGTALTVVKLERSDIIQLVNKSYTDKKISSIKPNDSNQIGTLMKHFKIPNTKTFRKHVARRPASVTSIQAILQDFKETDNIRKIMESCLYENIPQDHRKTPLSYHSEQNFGHFMDEMIAVFGETIWVNKMIAGELSFSALRDTGDMYYQIQKKRPDIEIDVRGNTHEMHERFTEILDSIKHPNHLLEYTEDQLALQREINGYKFHLGVDTNELRKVGRVMRICVGGYADRAHAKRVHIVLMTKGDEYVMCIELSKDGKIVNQAKLHCNDHPTGEEKETVTKWIKDCGLLVDTYDLPELRIQDEKKVRKHLYGEDQEIQPQAIGQVIAPEPAEIRLVNGFDNPLHVRRAEMPADEIEVNNVEIDRPADPIVELIQIDLPEFQELIAIERRPESAVVQQAVLQF